MVVEFLPLCLHVLVRLQLTTTQLLCCLEDVLCPREVTLLDERARHVEGHLIRIVHVTLGPVDGLCGLFAEVAGDAGGQEIDNQHLVLCVVLIFEQPFIDVPTLAVVAHTVPHLRLQLGEALLGVVLPSVKVACIGDFLDDLQRLVEAVESVEAVGLLELEVGLLEVELLALPRLVDEVQHGRPAGQLQQTEGLAAQGIHILAAQVQNLVTLGERFFEFLPLKVVVDCIEYLPGISHVTHLVARTAHTAPLQAAMWSRSWQMWSAEWP
mmetsp:Transcript_16001/g.38189  ORF Transcript_16001/g.38189 Transcript_16001/m.38189 type:complete len:268 (+) Transcript_16001:1663-2466(+)